MEGGAADADDDRLDDGRAGRWKAYADDDRRQAARRRTNIADDDAIITAAGMIFIVCSVERMGGSEIVCRIWISLACVCVCV